MIETKNIILLVSDYYSCFNFQSKLSRNGFDFEVVNLRDFLSDVKKYQHNLMLLPVIFLEIVEINLDQRSFSEKFQFILISNEACRFRKKTSNHRFIQILDYIHGNEKDNPLKRILNRHIT